MKKRLLLTILALIVTLVTFLTGCEKAPEPRVKEGRFNFSITYEVDGEEFTIASVFVCKFVEAGRGLSGYYITWDSYIEDRSIEELFPEDNYNNIIVQTNDDGVIYLDVDLHAEYFMAEPAYAEERAFSPYLYIKYNDTAAEIKGTYGDSDPAVVESYGVKLISYTCDSPIENVYE